MDDANGRVAAGQIALRAPKAHDEECVVVATEKRGRYFESLSVGAPCFSKGELDFSPAKTRLLIRRGFSPGKRKAQR